MTKTSLIPILLIFTSIIYSQKSITIYENEVQLLKYHGLSIYDVKEKEVFEYTYLDRIIELEKKSKIFDNAYTETVNQEYNRKLNYFNNRLDLLNKLKNKMDEYVNSSEKHKDKKHLLVEAQEIANEYGIKFDKEYKHPNSIMVSAEPILLSEYSRNCIKNGLVERFYNKLKDEHVKLKRKKPTLPLYLKIKTELDSLKKFKSKRSTYVVGEIELPIIAGEYRHY